MIHYIKAERLKQKHTSNNKLIWITPIVTYILVFLLMRGNFVSITAYNWWSVMFFPFTCSFLAATIIKKDKKYNYHGLFGIIEKKQKLWYAKIAIGTGYLFYTCLIFCGVIIISDYLFTQEITILPNLLASLLLFVTFAWQIPFFLFLTQKTNLIVSVAIGFVCNFGIACIFAVKSYWMYIPFCIPVRMMCSAVKVMPNGLPVTDSTTFINYNDVWLGVIITVLLYIVVSVATANIFKKQNVV